MQPSSTSSLDGEYNGSASTHQSNDSSSCSTPPSSAPQSSKSSVKSSAAASSHETKRPPPNSALKSPKSSPTLGVPFSLSGRSPEMDVKMRGLELVVPPLPSPQGWPTPSSPSPGLNHRASWNPTPSSPSSGLNHRASWNPTALTRIESNQTYRPIRPPLPKRFSTPAPLSRRDTNRQSTIPRYYSSQSRIPTTPITSPQSTTSSAPSVLYSDPTPPSPSQPPSQYNPLQHYVPCQATSCSRQYTTMLLGPTFYLPQQPYGLSRHKGLCAHHATQDLQRATDTARKTFESMRQNAGRKTLGVIAVEFEMWKQGFVSERKLESVALAAKQRKKVLRTASNTAPTKPKTERTDNDAENSKDGATTGGGEKAADGEWDWHYTPRPCTRADCTSQWWSPFDNKLYLLYHTPRPSGLTPLSTLCPPCARRDVEAAEERLNARKSESGLDREWRLWYEEVKKERAMEVVFWEEELGKRVREQGVVFGNGGEGGKRGSGGGGVEEGVGAGGVDEAKTEGLSAPAAEAGAGEKTVIKKEEDERVNKMKLMGVRMKWGKGKNMGKIKDICAVM